MLNYTRNEWRRCKPTLETSGETAPMTGYFRERKEESEKVLSQLETNSDRKSTLETSEEDVKLHSKRADRMLNTLETGGKDLTLFSIKFQN